MAPTILRRFLRSRISFLAIGFALVASMKIDAGENARVKIGMAKSFLFEKPKSYIDIAADEFKEVLKKTTGLEGELISKFGAFEIADKVQKKQMDFGVLHAHEFAWVQKRHPDLQPLLIAVNKHWAERAYLIVPAKSAVKTFADLRGKKLDVPSGNSAPSRMYLEMLTAKADPKGSAAYFGPIVKSSSASDALDGLARGKVDVVLVNAAGLEFYKENRGPVFAKNLRILQQSDPFPPTVIVHSKGAPAIAVLTQFRDGLLKANTIPLGREMMKTWNIDAFEAITTDYAKGLTTLLKVYPIPGSQR